MYTIKKEMERQMGVEAPYLWRMVPGPQCHSLPDGGIVVEGAAVFTQPVQEPRRHDSRQLKVLVRVQQGGQGRVKPAIGHISGTNPGGGGCPWESGPPLLSFGTPMHVNVL